MPLKRRRIDDAAAGDSDNDAACPSEPAYEASTTKRPRLVAGNAARPSTRADLLSPLSDELLVRILAHLPLTHLLSVAPVSRRFHRLAGDSQLWKRLYYERFVLPRALRIPGFRKHDHYYSSRRTAAVWRAVDGKRSGGVGRGGGAGGGGAGGWFDMRARANGDGDYDWKRQYKLRHNWSRGKCAVEELRVRDSVVLAAERAATPDSNPSSPKMLVKVCEGIAVTADATSGLRAWDLRTKQLVAHISLVDSNSRSSPSCLAIDDQFLQQQQPQQLIDVAVGFADGGFGVWRLDFGRHRLVRRYRHEKSTNGALVGTALSYPYLLTATESVLVSLYTFDQPLADPRRGTERESDTETEAGSETSETVEYNTEDDWARRTFYRKTNLPAQNKQPPETTDLPAPYLLTSLKSHTSRAPLALSIRKSAGATVASIAYTFSTLQGWSLGIQDLHLTPSLTSSKKTTDITTTRLAYTLPVSTAPSQVLSPPTSPARTHHTLRQGGNSDVGVDGPISICYTHPYLLATLPDNTLLLYLCKSTASSLSISPGIRLWGHTSGISDAEITARGKAVSVSCRGEEIRVWELEGRADGRSIEVRPTASTSPGDASEDDLDPAEAHNIQSGFDERRNWVGFDDEMVIVLKESRGRESLMVYDFT